MKFNLTWRRVIAVGGMESLGVILGGIAGLLIVNVLPKDQYAQYTFLISCMTLMLGIADAGLAHTCLPIVGQRAHEVSWVVGACSQVFRYRWRLLLIGVIIILPYWFVSSRQHVWHAPGYWIATALILLSAASSMRIDYVSTVLTILGHISLLTRVGFYALGARTILVLAVLALPVTQFSLSGLMAASLAAGLIGVWFYEKAFVTHSIKPVQLGPSGANEVHAELIRIAKPLFLPAIFYQFQGVITVLIVSLFGTADMLAEVGAIGRLTLMLVLFDKIARVLIFPVIAKAPDGKQLMAGVLKAHSAYIGAMTLILVSSLIYPQYWILLIGHQYEAQQDLLWMAFAASLLISCANFSFLTLTSRGNTGRQSYVVPLVLLSQLVCIGVFGVDTLRAVLVLGMATALAHFIYQYAMLIVWFKECRRARAQGIQSAAGE